jgi:hypothetical protein
VQRLADVQSSRWVILRAAGALFRNGIVTGPGGSQVLLREPPGNLLELFQPARRQ